ncbi:MAG: hypothetical protein PWQ32_1134 [Thermococcaceae archaeon]|nr:hypothetical protein [Thermococcaceae archaeon]
MFEDPDTKFAVEFLLYSGLHLHPEGFDFDELENELFDFGELFEEYEMMLPSELADVVYLGLMDVDNERLADSLGVQLENIRKTKKLLKEYLASYGYVY